MKVSLRLEAAELADTLEAIAQNGAAEFYNGSIAQSIVDEVCMYYNSYNGGQGWKGG